MSKGELFGLGALFTKPEQIIAAAKRVRDLGYRNFDVNTPYPVHGMDAAMGLKETSIGRWVFLFGLSGTLAALLLTGWTSVIDYPLVIGGKPLFSLPAFVPIIFELTVLLAALGGVGVMIAMFHQLPANSHSLHDSNYLQKTSSAHFGIYIESSDAQFDGAAVKNLFTELGAVSVEELFRDAETDNFRLPALNMRFVGALAGLFVAVAVFTWLHLQYGLNSPPFDWMAEQLRYDAQTPSERFDDGSSMLVPVANTIARGYIPYAYADDPDAAGRELVNPLLLTSQVLLRGQEQYDVFCSMCHGDLGEGDGRLNNKFPVPPSLHSQKLRREWSDGRIYHVLMMGQNSMPAYAKQIPAADRWAIIHYLRAMQRALNAKEIDIQ
jgi:mono/diheme cytochrome c family protein